MKNGSIRTAYMVVAGVITISSVSFTIGSGRNKRDVESISTTIKAEQNESQKRELRIQVLERLCERWDERWTNLQAWMARIDAKLEQINKE